MADASSGVMGLCIGLCMDNMQRLSAYTGEDPFDRITLQGVRAHMHALLMAWPLLSMVSESDGGAGEAAASASSGQVGRAAVCLSWEEVLSEA